MMRKSQTTSHPLREALRHLAGALGIYVEQCLPAQSDSDGRYEPIRAGHPVHQAVVALERCDPQKRLPGRLRVL